MSSTKTQITKYLTPFLVIAYLLFIWEVTLIVKLTNGAWPTMLVFIIPALIVIFYLLDILANKMFMNLRKVTLVQFISVLIFIVIIILYRQH